MRKIITLIVIITITVVGNAQNYSGGVGSSIDPFMISTLDDLRYLSEHNSGWSKYFIQTSDIDATETNTWNIGDHDNNEATVDVPMGFSPIGYKHYFSGSYNGGGHLISGLFINRPRTERVGFIGNAINATIDSLGIINCTIVGSNQTGGLIGRAYSITTVSNSHCIGTVKGGTRTGILIGESERYSNINNCYSSGEVSGNVLVGGFIGSNYNNSIIRDCYTTATVTGGSLVGGFAGDNYINSEIYNSYSECIVNSNSESFDKASAGGFSGENSHASLIKNCRCMSVVSSSSVGYNVGGFVGRVDGSNTVIENSYSEGSVTSNGGKVGGFVGICSNAAIIKNSYSRTNVSGKGSVGGFIGELSSTVVSCYSTGTAIGTANIGGFVGDNVGSASNCFWDKETSGITDVNVGVLGQTTAELKSLCLYLDHSWDFVIESNNGMEDVWVINADENDGYPAFSWQNINHTGECCNFNYEIIHNVEACNSYTWINNVTYTKSENVTLNYKTTCDADSNITLNLTVNYPQESDTIISACESFIWLGSEYTNSGIYIDTLQTISGCDSIVTLNLTVNNTQRSDTSAIACGAYTWYGDEYNISGDYTHTLSSIHGCDSIITLHLLVGNTQRVDTAITACNSFIWHNNVYTTSGLYVDTLQTVCGCDSIVKLDLWVRSMAALIWEDLFVLETNSNRISYQWLYCDPMYKEIEGATSYRYKPVVDGSYAVIVKESDSYNCIDTSDCYSITGVGIEEASGDNNIQLYPNPTKDNIQLIINNEQIVIRAIEIVDVYGKALKQLSIDNRQQIIDVSKLGSGMYIIRLSTDDQVYTKMFIKN